MLLAIGKTMYIICFLEGLDVTENNDICMSLGFTVTEKGFVKHKHPL